MIRRLHITLRASEALVALTTLHAPPADHAVAHGSSTAAAIYGARFGLDVARAFEAYARALEVLGQCLDWLERRGLCDVDRPRSRAGQRPPTWLSSAELRVDVRALAREVTAEADDTDSKARASAWALRMVLRHLAGTRQHVAEIRSGNERVPALEALASFDAVMTTAGFGAHAAPPTRLAHLAPRTKRKDEPVFETPTAAPTVTPPRPTAATAAQATKHAAKESPTEAGATTKRTTTKPRARPSSGFGGLPDDAVPEDRRTGDAYGPRGLTVDAEFFLAEAAIAAWPCDSAVLERGRRAVVSKLHPDRAGEASTQAFHRAIKGHAELAKKLSVATPTGATVTVTATATVTAVSATVSATTPTPTVATKSQPRETVSTVAAAAPTATVAPSETPGSPRVRRPRGKAIGSQTEPSPAPPTHASPSSSTTVSVTSSQQAESARATTFEWPPRPAEPPPVAVPPAPPRAPSLRRMRSA